MTFHSLDSGEVQEPLKRCLAMSRHSGPLAVARSVQSRVLFYQPLLPSGIYTSIHMEASDKRKIGSSVKEVPFRSHQGMHPCFPHGGSGSHCG